MKTDVGALVIIDMNGHFSSGLELAPGFQLVAFRLRPHDIVGFASWNALRKFAGMVGILFPARLFLVGRTNLDGHPVQGVAIGIPYSAVD